MTRINPQANANTPTAKTVTVAEARRALHRFAKGDTRAITLSVRDLGTALAAVGAGTLEVTVLDEGLLLVPTGS